MPASLKNPSRSVSSPFVVTRTTRRMDQSTGRSALMLSPVVSDVFSWQADQVWKSLRAGSRKNLTLLNLRVTRSPQDSWEILSPPFRAVLRVGAGSREIPKKDWKLEMALNHSSEHSITVQEIKSPVKGVKIKKLDSGRYEISVNAPMHCSIDHFREPVLLTIRYKKESEKQSRIRNLAVDFRCLLGDAAYSKGNDFALLALNARKDRALRRLVDRSRGMPALLGNDESDILNREVRRLKQLSRVKPIMDPPDSGGADFPQDYQFYVLSPTETLRLGGGDCEDLSLLAGAYLAEMGFAVELVMIPGHAYCRVRIERDGVDRYLDVDLTLKGPQVRPARDPAPGAKFYSFGKPG